MVVHFAVIKYLYPVHQKLVVPWLLGIGIEICHQIVIRHGNRTVFNATSPVSKYSFTMRPRSYSKNWKKKQTKMLILILQQPPTAIRAYYNEELWVSGGGKILNQMTEEVIEALRFKTLICGYNLLMYAVNK